MHREHFKNITLQQMESLLCLIQEGSFSRAAQKMLLTQPALTKNIKNIEDALGAKVVNRSKAGISLTPTGNILYSYTRRILKLRNEANEKILKLSDNAGGDIYIGASTIPGTYILPRVLGVLKKEHPAICVHVQTADSVEAINMVLDKQVEIGFIGKKPFNNKLIAEKLGRDRLVLAVGPNHPWRKKKSVTLPELMAESFIIREKGSATREALEQCLRESYSINLSQFNICGELSSSEAIKEAILAGFGISVVSIRAIERELAQGLLFEVDLSGCKLERDFYLIYLRQWEMTPVHKLFIDFIKSVYSSSAAF